MGPLNGMTPPMECHPDLTAITTTGPFTANLALADGTGLQTEEVLRCLPGRRLVCRGIWQGHAVIGKIFFGPDSIRRAARDATGTKALSTAGIATPTLLHEGSLSEQAAPVLIYAYLPNGETADIAWQKADAPQRLAFARRLVEIIASHHVAGLVQTDLYLRNFLCAGNLIYTLDGDGIRHLPGFSARRAALSNLGLLLSKLEPEFDAHSAELFSDYASLRGWTVTPGLQQTLQQMIRQARRRSVATYARKVFRNCTDVEVMREPRRFTAINRHLSLQNLEQILKFPDRLLDDPACLRLKNGNSSTVGLLQEQGKIVIKRYNIKSMWHGIKRALQPSRASRSWSNAHALQLLGVATATPVALVEERWGPLRGRSYFLAQLVEGTRLDTLLADPAHGMEEKQAIAMLCARLMYRLYLLGIEHGDLKASNMKVLDHELYLLDLDAMRVHGCKWWFELRHVRDLKRLLRNWQNDALTQALMQKALRAVYGPQAILNKAGIEY